ncbi:MAG: hypothetical protein ACOYOL_13280 [Chthoniobacterales bacterium]
MKTNSPKIKNCFLGMALVVASLVPSNVCAQVSAFRTTNQPLTFAMIGTNGAASRYDLLVGVSRTGVISVDTRFSRRYDIAATSSSIVPAAGVSVGRTNSTALVSSLGTPIITNVTESIEPVYQVNPSDPVTYVTNKTTNLEVPFAIFLTDGGRIKGTIKRTVYYGYTNFSFEGGATHQGKIGFGGTDYPDVPPTSGPWITVPQ